MTKLPTLNLVRRRRSTRVSEGLSSFYGIAAVGMVVALGGCSGVMETKRSADGPGMVQQPPANAIQVGDDHYMVPVDKDASGCERFTPWSASAAVKTALYYRKSDGSFTLNKVQADCSAG